MFKKILVMALTITLNSNAVILKNGSTAPYSRILEVRTALSDLAVMREHDGWYCLDELYKACKSDQKKIMPNIRMMIFDATIDSKTVIDIDQITKHLFQIMQQEQSNPIENASNEPLVNTVKFWLRRHNAALVTLHAKGLCDKEGNIDKDTANIIQSSLFMMHKGPVFMGCAVLNPISWKNYTSIDYWFGCE